MIFSWRSSSLGMRLVVTLSILCLVSWLPLRIQLAHLQTPQPQAIFVLGGNHDRARTAAQLWHKHPDMNVWLSSNTISLKRYRNIFLESGVPEQKLSLDGRARDTVTNFTTMVSTFEDASLSHLYIVTSDYHMRRARMIAFFVFGSRKIVVTPVFVESSRSSESLLRALRDGCRSIIWLLTGKTGASLSQR